MSEKRQAEGAQRRDKRAISSASITNHMEDPVDPWGKESAERPQHEPYPRPALPTTALFQPCDGWDHTGDGGISYSVPQLRGDSSVAWHDLEFYLGVCPKAAFVCTDSPPLDSRFHQTRTTE